ncbi:hypothetical protein BDF20DRAFT_861162 [Mycotypha africana]|uniref:uncharacterized protein n=1 Tax=Mycotypha africana TaxID=64632 RepID=UPI0023011260|nr:uncharacterized protein BDF20DRAFT_861162 [Mycotypha africana]KAI8984671.1 hypothetical protein BDF20DRAFT_861162 [Mycotypha africana]
MTDFEAMADEVLSINNSKSRSDILADLKYTKNANATLNRIFDGQFLIGTDRDPSIQKPELIILDSDEEEALSQPDRSTCNSSTSNLHGSSVSRLADDWNNSFLSSSQPPSLPMIDINEMRMESNGRKTNSQFNNDKLNDIILNNDDDMKEDKLFDMNSIILSKTNFDDNNQISQRVHLTDKYVQQKQKEGRKQDNSEKEIKEDVIDKLQLSTLSSRHDNTRDNNDVDDKQTPRRSILFENYNYIYNVELSDVAADERDLSLGHGEKTNDLCLLLDEDVDRKTSFNGEIQPTKNNKIEYSEYNISSDYEDDVDHLPSTTDFFEELMTQTKKPKKSFEVFEIDDSDDEDIVTYGNKSSPRVSDWKGKRKAAEAFSEMNDDYVDYNIFDIDSLQQRPRYLNDYSDSRSSSVETTLTAKERKKLEVDEKKRLRVEAAEEKKRQKAQLAEEKKRMKEQKLLEKERQQLLEKENRIRSNRSQILQEMIIDVHPDFKASKPGELLERILQAKEAEVTVLDPSANHTIGWRRKITSEWDNDSQAFIPIAHTKVVRESFILVYMTALQFVDRIQRKSMDAFIDKVAEPNYQILLMVEGLSQYYKKKLLYKRRQYDNQVRNAFRSEEEQQQPLTSSRRKTKTLNELIINGPEQNVIEEYLNYLMLVRNIMLVPTKDVEDTANWIESLTTDLALGRYKSRNINNSYRVSKCGTDPQDTYIKMLQEIQLCTPAVARSVISAYPSLQRLHRAYERTQGRTAGELMLADLEVERSALQLRDRTINRAMSRKIYSIFTSSDPEEIIY